MRGSVVSGPPRAVVIVTIAVEAPVVAHVIGVESAADARRLQHELHDGEKTMLAIAAALAEVWEELRERARETS